MRAEPSRHRVNPRSERGRDGTPDREVQERSPPTPTPLAPRWSRPGGDDGRTLRTTLSVNAGRTRVRHRCSGATDRARYVGECLPDRRLPGAVLRRAPYLRDQSQTGERDHAPNADGSLRGQAPHPEPTGRDSCHDEEARPRRLSNPQECVPEPRRSGYGGDSGRSLGRGGSHEERLGARSTSAKPDPDRTRPDHRCPVARSNGALSTPEAHPERRASSVFLCRKTSRPAAGPLLISGIRGRVVPPGRPDAQADSPHR